MQVATLFRESATLLGASMEGADIHGLKMAVFSEGGLKQETQDDGYETSVDHLDLRPSSGGKSSHDSEVSAHLQVAQQHSSSPQMQQMQLVHGGHLHHFVEQRLHARVHSTMVETRLSLDENGLPDGDPMGHDSRLSPGQDSHGSQISIDTRLSSHDSMEGINTIRHDVHLGQDGRMLPLEMDSQLSNAESQSPHHLDNTRPNSAMINIEARDSHMSSIESRINHERQLTMDNRVAHEQVERDRELESRLAIHEQMNRERLLDNRTPREHLNRERLLEQRLHEQVNRDGTSLTHQELELDRDRHEQLEQLNRDRLSLDHGMTPHESMDRERFALERRLSAREQMEQMNRERLPIEHRLTPEQIDQIHRERLSMEHRMTPHEQMDQMNRDRIMDHHRMTPHEVDHMSQDRPVKMERRLAPHELNNMEHISRDRGSIENRLTPRDNHIMDNNHISNADKRLVNHDMVAMDARINNRIEDSHLNIEHINGIAHDLTMENRMMAHGEMHRHEHMAHMNRVGMMAHGQHVHENHMVAHMAHINPHEHMQHTHSHMQGLHHPHHAHAQHGHPHHLHHAHHSHHSHIKCDSMEDPYSFVDEENGNICPPIVAQQQRPSPILLQPVPKKRGRKKKVKPEDGIIETTELLKKENGLVKPTKERKKHDRFNGMPEEEVVKRTLPDHLTPNLDIVIIGTNPGLYAAYKGHHYAGPGTHIWKCLYLSGLTPEPMTADDDYKLLQVGIGFTNMVARATKGSADLTRKEIKEGSQILLEKLQKFKPKIAVFNGKLIYEVFSGNKDFHFGRQPDFVDGTNTYMWVMPSSSARCAQLPRAADKVPFYSALKKFRDYLNGLVADIDDAEVVFSDQKLKTFYESEVKGEPKDEHGNFFPYSRIPGQVKNDLTELNVNKDPNRPEKKKRGRPKKIRVEGEEPPPPKERVKKEKPPVDSDAPKKKRGRPKKIKTEDQPIGTQAAQQPTPQSLQNSANLNVSEHTNSSNPTSACFSPANQSPSGFCQGFSPAYGSQNQNSGGTGQFSSRAPSPAPPHQSYHQSPHHASPIPAQFPQSPPATSQSQAYTHSDLSSEISAAISSEHLGSPPPTSPSLGPPDFEPPTSMPDDSGPMSAKEEGGDPECSFSSPTPSESNTYQYQGFQEQEVEHKPSSGQFSRQPSPEFPAKRQNQDVASKSLSGLESLVDQIPSIADNSGVAPVGTPSTSDSFEAQPSGQYEDYMGGYPGYSGPPAPHYTSSTNFSSPGYIPPTQSNFSVSSLANSSHEAQVASSFSVSSLASNYAPSGYPNLMGAPHLVVPQPGLFGSGMNVPANYQYPGQYSSGAASFPYSPHALHVPSPNYPPYSPYSNSSYPQPYLANHVLDRIKQERMDIGFGGF